MVNICSKDDLVDLIFLKLYEEEYVQETNEYHFNRFKEIIRDVLDDYIVIKGLGNLLE